MATVGSEVARSSTAIAETLNVRVCACIWVVSDIWEDPTLNGAQALNDEPLLPRCLKVSSLRKNHTVVLQEP